MVAVINCKFPDIGHLLLSRVILQFKRAFRRNDRPVAVAAVKFLAHLTNQQVCVQPIGQCLDSCHMYPPCVQLWRPAGSHFNDLSVTSQPEP